MALLLLLAQPGPDTDTSAEQDAPTEEAAPDTGGEQTAPEAAGPDTGKQTAPAEQTAPEAAAQGLDPVAPRIVVEVIALRPHGQITPATAEVRLERRRQTPGGGSSTTYVALAMTDAQGRAAFSAPPLGMGESDRIIARFDGHEVATALTAERNGVSEPVRLIVREVSRDLSRLKMDIRIGLTPLDTVLRLEHLIRFDNPTHMIIDTDQGQGLRIPLLLPAPFGEPAQGLFPGRPDPNELIMQLQPDAGRLQVERGDLVYRGAVPPDGLTLRIIMAIPYDGSPHHALALLPSVDLAALTFIAQSPPNVGLNLSVDRPAQPLTRNSQGGEELTLTVIDPPKAGTPLRVTVANTPDRHGLMRPLAAGISIAIVAALLVLLAAPRARKKDAGPTTER